MTVKHSGRVLLVVALMLTALLALTGGVFAMDAVTVQATAAHAPVAIAASQSVTDTAAVTDAAPAGPMNVVETAVSAGNFTTLVSALTEKGLVETLSGEGPFTVFAPTDAAFEAMPLKERIALYKGADTLTQTLLYHVVPGTIMAADITDGMTVKTVQGDELTFTVADGSVAVNGVPISKADIEATNGVIHVIDGVLMPPSETALTAAAAAAAAAAVTETAELTEAAAVTTTAVVTEAAAVTATEAMTEAAAMTETAAMTEAMPMTETAVMTEAAATAEAAAMTETAVMTEAAATAESSAPATLPTTGAAHEDAKDIVDIAVANPDFSTLVAAVQAAGLADALKGDGPFTVFAPTNEAFAKIPSDTLNALLADPTGDLTQILLYHVVPGKVMAADVTDGLEATTLQGSKVKFSVADGVVKVNDSVVTATDIVASNGVIHVIDTVLTVPAAAEPVAEAAPMTETVVVTEAAAMTETAAMTEAAPVVEAAAMTETVVVTEAAPVVEAAAMTETAVMTEAAPAEAAPAEAAPAEAAAPETLPTTGGSAQPSMNLSLLVAGLVLVLVAVVAFVTRRRTA